MQWSVCDLQCVKLQKQRAEAYLKQDSFHHFWKDIVASLIVVSPEERQSEVELKDFNSHQTCPCNRNIWVERNLDSDPPRDLILSTQSTKKALVYAISLGFWTFKCSMVKICFSKESPFKFIYYLVTHNVTVVGTPTRLTLPDTLAEAGYSPCFVNKQVRLTGQYVFPIPGAVVGQ